MNTDNSLKKYDSVQCIGFSLNTGLHHNEYSGLANITDDWTSRVDIMKEAVDTSYMSPQINTKPNCLKIFMAPEFFFRGLKGAYDMETASKITEKLRAVVNDSKFDDWLFVFGTIVSYSKESDENSKMHEVYNYSFIQKGNSDESNSFIVMKEHKSGVDFVNSIYSPKTSDPNDLDTYNTQHLLPTKNPEKRSELKKFNYDSNAVFEVDGLRIGLEICLDNIYKRINCSYIPDEKPIDIHLVTSCGVSYQRLTEKISKDGIGFICDGSLTGFSTVIDTQNRDVNPPETNFFHPPNSKIFRKIFNSHSGNIDIFQTHYFNKTLHKNNSSMEMT